MHMLSFNRVIVYSVYFCLKHVHNTLSKYTYNNTSTCSLSLTKELQKKCVY